MAITIDTVKLISIIEQELRDINGACIEGEVVIGDIDGRQIRLVVNGQTEDHEPGHAKYRCVTKVKTKKGTA